MNTILLNDEIYLRRYFNNEGVLCGATIGYVDGDKVHLGVEALFDLIEELNMDKGKENFQFYVNGSSRSFCYHASLNDDRKTYTVSWHGDELFEFSGETIYGVEEVNLFLENSDWIKI